MTSKVRVQGARELVWGLGPRCEEAQVSKGTLIQAWALSPQKAP